MGADSADLGWWDAYDDPQLKTYIAEALTNSWDIKIAAARVLQALSAAFPMVVGRRERVVVATPANCGWVGKRRSGPRGRAVGAVAGFGRCENLQWVLSCPVVE